KAGRRFGPRDLLAIQLDTRAVFLGRWRDLILRTLIPAATTGHADRAAFRELVERRWDGPAWPPPVGHRSTGMFPEQVSEAGLTFVLSECYLTDATFDH